MVSRLKDENVVELLGYCVDGGFRVLAYEYAPNGSLHDILHGMRTMLWSQLEPSLNPILLISTKPVEWSIILCAFGSSSHDESNFSKSKELVSVACVRKLLLFNPTMSKYISGSTLRTSLMHYAVNGPLTNGQHMLHPKFWSSSLTHSLAWKMP